MFIFYPSISLPRDVLPFTLKLPEAIASAKTQKELEEVAQLGAGNLIYCFIVCSSVVAHILNDYTGAFASLNY